MDLLCISCCVLFWIGEVSHPGGWEPWEEFGKKMGEIEWFGSEISSPIEEWSLT